MKPGVIIDAGPLVALLNRRDAHHEWATEQVERFSGPMLTCEAVLSEALFLLRNVSGSTAQIVGLLRSGGVRPVFVFEQEAESLCRLLVKYSDVPMSLADACIVRMSELFPKHVVLTLDDDFNIYRRNRNRGIPVVSPHSAG